MVNTKEAKESKYLNVDIVKESKSKKVVFLGEGSYEYTDYGRRLTLPVEIDGQKKEWRPNRDTVKALSAAWGDDTAAWIGKIASIQPITIRGKESILGYPATDTPPKKGD